MDDQCLVRLAMPALPRRVVPRPRLQALMGDALEGGVVVLSGPAGAGKTVAMRLFADASPLINWAWLTLDAEANDPVAFWDSVVAALARGPLALSAKEAQRRSNDPAVMIARMVESDDQSGSVGLVLDDFQMIDHPEVIAGLASLIEHLPPALRLVLATRQALPARIGRLRASGRLEEIGTEDLYFQRDEAEALLALFEGVALDLDHVSLLVERTEGWPVGLQLAALSVQHRADQHRFIEQFAGADRAIADFLGAEVLDHQPRQIQEFLRATSILKRLSAPLCDELMSRTDSGMTLRCLEANNLFLVRLEGDSGWYRYHQLFRELLEADLRATDSARIAGLHRRAGSWYAKVGDVASAAGHYQEGDDPQAAIGLVAKAWFEELETGRGAALAPILDRLPAPTRTLDPVVASSIGAALALLGRPDDGVVWLSRCEEGTVSSDRTKAERQARGLRASAWTFAYAASGELERSAATGERALRAARAHHSTDGAQRWQDDVPILLARVYNGMGRHELARAAVARLGPQSQLHGPFMHVERYGVLSQTAFGEGDLCQAEALASHSLTRVEEHGLEQLPGALDARLTLAAICRERNEVDLAIAELGHVLDAPHGTASTITRAAAGLELAQALFVTPRPGAAFELLSEFSHGTPGRHVPVDMVWRFCALEARLRLLVGDIDGARPLLDRVVDPATTELLRARLDILEGEPEKACARLDDLSTPTLSLRSTIEMLILRSIATLALDRVEAEQSFGAALRRARPQRFVRLFLDEGRDLAPLLERNGIVAVTARSGPRSRELTAGSARGPLERLSDRERLIVRYLNGSMPQSEIASNLIISENTLKTHLKSIYRKLGANSRHQAVVRARELGLI